MKFILATLSAALVSPIIAQSTTPAPTAATATTTTTTGAWHENGPPWASEDPAKWSSIYHSLVSDGKIPSTLTAAPWPTGPYGPGRGPWGPDDDNGPGGPGRHWGGPDGPGPWGPSNYGPYSDWSTRTDWRNGPWTAWWDGTQCPHSDWPGWTAGPWGTSPPWTTWSACTASTTATSVVTTTVDGSVTTSTQYGLRVAAATVEASAGTRGRLQAGIGAVVAGAVLGLAVGL